MRVTISGADDYVDYDKLERIAAAYPSPRSGEDMERGGSLNDKLYQIKHVLMLDNLPRRRSRT